MLLQLNQELQVMTPDQSTKFCQGMKNSELMTLDSNTLKSKNIPFSTDYYVVSAEQWSLVQKQAVALYSSAKKLAHFLRKNTSSAFLDFFMNGMQDEEKEYFKSNAADSDRRVAIRIDYFFDKNQNLRILELNTTIPTMQGYSEILCKQSAKAMGLSEKKFLMNALFLSQEINTSYRKLRGVDLKSLAIATRKNDPQIFEMQYLQKVWNQTHGWNAVNIDADALDTRPGSEKLVGKQIEFDAVYRHIFFWRMKKNSGIKRAILEPRRFAVFNPISSFYEQKALLALLSHAICDPSSAEKLGISTEEVDLLSGALCKTFFLNIGAATLSEVDSCSFIKNSLAPSLDTIKNNPDDYVLKPNFGYGGQSVVIGSEINEPGSQQKLRRMMDVLDQSTPITWQRAIDWAHGCGPFAWLVQEKMQGKKKNINIVRADGSITSQEVYLDLNVFLGEADGVKACGGAVRFSPNIIVNIAQGGGLVPFLVEA